MLRTYVTGVWMMSREHRIKPPENASNSDVSPLIQPRPFAPQTESTSHSSAPIDPQTQIDLQAKPESEPQPPQRLEHHISQIPIFPPNTPPQPPPRSSIFRKSLDLPPSLPWQSRNILRRSTKASAGGDASTELESAINQARGGGQSLESSLQGKMEQAMGADFSGVKIHTDAQSDQLNQSIQARAFTTGQDIFFRQGQYNPGSMAGQELIAHELTHVVQQNGATVQRSTQAEQTEDSSVAESTIPKESAEPDISSTATDTNVVQRTFNPVTVLGNAHLRTKNNWDVHHGDTIKIGSDILMDDFDNHAIVDDDITWRPAINISPTAHPDTIADNLKGYIRDAKAFTFPWTKSLAAILQSQIGDILEAAEQKYPQRLKNKLHQTEVKEFLLDKALRYKSWNSEQVTIDTFIAGFLTLDDKLERIRDGANYVADSLEYWRKWLHSETPDRVKIEQVKFLQSDLHEEGLGVLMVKFTKPLGPLNSKFADQTTVEVVIKPEDKSLEANLLGDSPNSAANQINQIVGLAEPNEALTTIKMECTTDYGSLVEKVQGTKAEDLVGGGNLPVSPVFHETLVFSFLAGLDDLHKENVYWEDGKPYLIDADNVLSYNQLKNKDNGSYTQGGFGSNYNNVEANENKQAIANYDNTVNSKILKTMLEDEGKARQIMNVIKGAISGKKGRVVPIKTSYWGMILRYYTSAPVNSKGNFIRDYSSEGFIVRQGVRFDSSIGPGLIGTSYKNINNEFYDVEAEKVELKNDLDAGVIPFYLYDYDSGHVTHNGTTIYHGQTLDQAIQVVLDHFSTAWQINDFANIDLN